MRGMFVKTLFEIAKADSRVALLTGDLGFSVLEPFRDTFPERFFNVGVAEQNMVGIATGLAKEGMIPFVYSIGTFASLRPYEFIRNGPVHHHLPVRVVAVGGGYEYGHAGSTHHVLEDLAIMRVHPELTTVCPADPNQMREAMLKTWDLPGPVYFRIGKDDKRFVPDFDGAFRIGVPELIGAGKDVLFVATGSITSEVAKARTELQAQGVDSSVMIVSTLNPIDTGAFLEVLEQFKTVVTVEVHYITGGLGSLICELIAENGLRSRVIRCGVTTGPAEKTGSENYLLKSQGLSAPQLVERVRQSISEAAN